MPIRHVLPLSRFLLVAVLAVAVLGSGCSSIGGMFKRDKEPENAPVEQLYDKGHTSMENGNWTEAVNHFKRLTAQYPFGPYTEQAMMETAYAQFKAGLNDDAVSTIDRFLRTYPTNRNVPYMYYLRGLVNATRDTVFLQRVWRLDPSQRDLSSIQQAYSDFGVVVERYPNSRYAADARARMLALRNIAARHEIDIALYYLRRGAYLAAVDRAKELIETYPQSAYQDDAVAVLADAYTRLGYTTLAADARRVLETNAPNHPWLHGDWPNYPGNWRKLNPFAGEQSAADRSAH